MTDKSFTQRAIEWTQTQKQELQSKIEQLTTELDKTKREYDECLAILNKLQQESVANSFDTQENFLNNSLDTDSCLQAVDLMCGTSSAYDWQEPTLTQFQEEKREKALSESEDIDNYSFNETNDYEDEADDYEENEENNSSPKDWLRHEYQNRPMEDVVFEILKQCQPARPGDVALRMYQIQEDDPNFERARNSTNAALTNGKKVGKWKTLKRGVYVLNDYPESFQARIGQNGHA